jgi:tetratricopeptide (TPR) repeat protein
VLEQVYEPLPWKKVWPLFKLKRLDEARKAIEETERGGRWKLRSLNDRCALEEQCRNRKGTYDAGKLMVQEIPYSPVLWSNFGEAARSMFELEEAERAFFKSATLGRPDFYGTAYRPLALLYLQQGKLKPALEALKKGQAQRMQRPPHSLAQDQTKMDRSIGLLLLAVGMGEEAERFVRRAVDRPDRTGSTTEDATDLAISNLLMLWTVLQTRLEQLAEADAAKAGLGSLAPSLEQKSLQLQLWQLERALLKLLHDPSRLSVIRPYMPGAAEMEPWLRGSLVRILPPGVTLEAIRQARAEETHPAAAAYFDALEAEVELLRGSPAEALALARKAMDKLPAPEKLLRARAAAVAAEAARLLGRNDEALSLYRQVLRDFPQALRLVRTVLPVRVETDGSPLAATVARRLAASPRFREDPNGLRLVVRVRDNRVSLELFVEGDERHCEALVAADGAEDAVIAAALRELHARMMSPVLRLSAVDVNGLDSSPSAVRGRSETENLLKTGAR